ncbi:MAG: bifunctional 2-polyprenyl-6-hydroxyphenol methylase/3-demethylubiquinol 3-O-methyltransferase UbiG [Rhodospirillales bacterium]|nr:bifunctional 2-polyprenyl-6-hydroxyphenol methylase/3-demethylubiquinol 3-O-methyltransferase UbiG [Rhodospirillales bacterium]
MTLRSEPSDRTAFAKTAADDEIARFEAMARSWWDPQGDFRALHQLNPVRVDFIRTRLARHFARDVDSARPFDGLTMIDIGCGGGLVAEQMARCGASITGIDASEEAIRIAGVHAHAAGLDIDYRRAGPEDLAREGARFDVVLALEVVEHVADHDDFAAAITALLAPGGAMILSTLNRTWASLALAKVGAEYVLNWVPRGTHDWRKFVKPAEMAQMLRRQGLLLTDAAGLSYNPLRQSWSLSRKLDVNYMAMAR